MLVWGVLVVVILMFPYLLRKTAPYGRHYTGTSWGPHISTRLTWIVMELLAPLVFLGVFLTGKHAFEIVPLLFLAMWQAHYPNRMFVYPVHARAGGRKMALMLVGSG